MTREAKRYLIGRYKQATHVTIVGHSCLLPHELDALLMSRSPLVVVRNESLTWATQGSFWMCAGYAKIRIMCALGWKFGLPVNGLVRCSQYYKVKLLEIGI